MVDERNQHSRYPAASLRFTVATAFCSLMFVERKARDGRLTPLQVARALNGGRFHNTPNDSHTVFIVIHHHGGTKSLSDRPQVSLVSDSRTRLEDGRRGARSHILVELDHLGMAHLVCIYVSQDAAVPSIVSFPELCWLLELRVFQPLDRLRGAQKLASHHPFVTNITMVLRRESPEILFHILCFGSIMMTGNF